MSQLNLRSKVCVSRAHMEDDDSMRLELVVHSFAIVAVEQ